VCYSPNVLEGVFSELRLNGVLRSSHSPDPIRQALRRAYRGLGAWDDHRPPNAVTGVKLVYGRRRRYLRLVARLSKAQHDPYARLGGTVKQEGRIPFDPHTDFDRISERALLFAPRAFGYGGVLRITGGAKRTGTAKDHRGATYEQLARIAYRLGIDKHQRNARKMWYRTARDVMLSEAHAEQIIGSLEDPGNP
jgi:hypothetical protein